MPRYFFNVHDGVDRPDPDGTVLPNSEAAPEDESRATSRIAARPLRPASTTPETI
ncbi:DUF6894 family protein [Methylobacterium gnaphalii]|uniref:DUF6894 family protein n=1 Tax=Methylobacterium gnaphalii TaxID=1010610 RepID=UPI0035712F91